MWKFARRAIRFIRGSRRLWIRLGAWVSLKRSIGVSSVARGFFGRVANRGREMSSRTRICISGGRRFGGGSLLHFSSVVCTAAVLFLQVGVGLAGERFVRIEKVVDGDTVALADGEHVRLLGINTPEAEWRGKGGKVTREAEPLADEATRVLRELVEGRRVRLVVGERGSDGYGRTLAQVFLEGGEDVQLDLIRRGLAMVEMIPPIGRYAGRYAEAECRARRRGVGIWGDGYYAAWEVGVDKPLKKSRRRFHRVRGRVTGVSRGRFVEVVLGDAFTLRIARADWRRYWGEGEEVEPDFLVGRVLTVHGRVRFLKGGAVMRIGHPSMVEGEVC